jgi:2-methylcitrate dehydratase PrpD
MNSPAESVPIEKLAANVLETRFEDLDQEGLEYGKSRIIDVVGCLIGGANDTGNPGLVELARDWGGKEEATILIYGGKVPAHNAAMVNSILARSFDFEPVGPVVDGMSGGGHLSGSTVMTAITMGEVKGIDGRELVTAMLAGDDVASRILVAGSAPLMPGSKWPNPPTTGTINGFGTTAIAGRLLGLNKRQMRNAFGIVLNQIGGSFQMIWDGTTAFKLTQGLPCRNGIFSAQLAKAGWTGPEDALLSQFGYYELFTKGCSNPQALTKDLGRKYYGDGTIKPYPCCRMNHGAIDCALALVEKYGIEAQDIQDVIIYASSVALNHICAKPFRIGDFPHGNAAFSFQYTVATALMKKSVKPEHFTEESIRDPQTGAFIQKIRFAELPDVEAHGIKLKVIMKDGRELVERCDVAKGDMLRNPMSKDEIIHKYWTNVEYSQAITIKNAEKLLALLEKVEELDNVNRIVPLLVP